MRPPAAFRLRSQTARRARPAHPGSQNCQHATIAFHGRVLGPQGKPVAGASIYTFAPKSEESMPAALRTKAASDGKFQFEIVKVELDAVTERRALGRIDCGCDGRGVRARLGLRAQAA